MTSEGPDSGHPGTEGRTAGRLMHPVRRDGGVERGDDQRASALDRVRGVLLRAGATEEEIDQAVAGGVVDLLAVDRLLVPSTRHYSAAEVTEVTGLAVDLLKRLWRALGFHDFADDEAVFTDLDIAAVRSLQAMLGLGATEVDTALHLARVIGSSMARIAEAEVLPASIDLGAYDDDVLAADAFAGVADAAVPAMASLLEFVWRRHMQAASRRTMLLRAGWRTAGAGPVLAVGFADMVGFTLLSRHLDRERLVTVVQRFEEISHDIVTSLGGRVVKMIGDEAMFVIESVAGAARIGLGLAEAYAHDDLLSDVRVGLAVGPVLVNDGDYYGSTVNLAHRIVNVAKPGTVVLSDEFHSLLTAEAAGEFVADPLEPRTLKDLGQMQLWRCARAVPAPSVAGQPEGRYSVGQ